MKLCSKCDETKNLDNFARNQRKKDGLQSRCRACDRAVVAAWRKKNPEKARAASKAWYAANTEKVRAAKAAWVKANPERNKASHAAWLKANPGKVREYNLRRLGFTRDSYALAIALQDNQCAICERDFGELPTSNRACADHDHATGRARGVLCQECNFGLGYFADSRERLTNAAHYLTRPTLQ